MNHSTVTTPKAAADWAMTLMMFFFLTMPP
jgi:hypothetical protein